MQKKFLGFVLFHEEKKNLLDNLSVVFSHQWGLHMRLISIGGKCKQVKKSEQFLVYFADLF